MNGTTVSKIVDGLELSATPHAPFPEGNRIAAELLDVLAPVLKIAGSKFTVSDGQGGRKPIAMQEALQQMMIKGADGKPDINWALAADLLAGIGVDDVVAAIVAAVRRLFLDDAGRAERLFLALLSNTTATVPGVGGVMVRLPLGTTAAFSSVIGTSYRRQFAILAFAVGVSFGDVFGGGWAGGPPGTSPA